MAKDTEKLIRQLSLISFLMASRRPVTALEIKQEVEGYSSMNDDAFARRFYADRAELESLGIELKVDKPGEGFFESELYALPPENYYLPPIEFTEGELAALHTALSLLDDEFAYAEPLRLALQQVTWGRANPLSEGGAPEIELAAAPSAQGKEVSQRLAKIETAISRRKTVRFSYYTMERDEESGRKVDPYHLVYRDGQFYLIGYSHERDAVRVFRLSRIRGKVSYATKAEHDFTPPEDFDRSDYGSRSPWQMGDADKTARIFVRDRIAWLVEREYGVFGTLSAPGKGEAGGEKGVVYETRYASPRQMAAWVLGWRGNARVIEPGELAEEVDRRQTLLAERHHQGFGTAKVVGRPAAERAARGESSSNGRSTGPSGIRPERFARLVTLAGMLIRAGTSGERLPIADVCADLGIDRGTLADDVAVLNVINFGGGTYVLYAELGEKEIEVDPEAYGDSFDKPARLLPLEAKALVAAIDLFGNHLPQANLSSVRDKIVDALGHDPSREGLEITPEHGDSEVISTVNEGITGRRVVELDYYKEAEDSFTKREIEPYRLAHGQEGWYVGCWDRSRKATRHFRLDRVRSAKLGDEAFEPREEVAEELAAEDWLSDGEVIGAEVARVWVSPERARWLREERTVVEELADGAAVVELPFAGKPYLVREILRGAGDMVVLEPEDAREAVRKALAA